MADPLSSATRANKRNLLIASVVAISANAFKVSISSIPMGGLSITFDDRLFAFLLVTVLLYFLVTFTLYYFIDIKNLETTEHQKAAHQRYHNRVGVFPEQFRERVAKELQAGLPEGLEFQASSSFGPDGQTMKYRLINGVGERRSILEHREDEGAYARIDAHQKVLFASYPRHLAMAKFRAGIPLYAVKSAYWMRNYLFDGALPILLGVFAATSLFAHWDLSWLQGYLPSFRGK